MVWMTKEKNYRRGFTSFLQKSLIKTAAKNNLKTLSFWPGNPTKYLLWNKQFLEIAAVSIKNVEINKGIYSIYAPFFTVLPKHPFVFNSWLVWLQIMRNP